MKLRYLFFVLICIALLVVIYLIGRPVEPLPIEPMATTQAPAEKPAAVTIRYEFDQAAAYEPELHRVEQGSPVIIEVVATPGDELHVHGYDLHLPVPAGVPSRLEFVAEHSGRFEVELHESETVLGVLEVTPAT